MAYKVVWSSKAIITFDKIVQYILDNWTEKEVKSFVRATDKVISLISENPFLFRSSEKAKIHEVLISKHNLLLYQISERNKKIQVLGFFDTRQNPKRKKRILKK